jgi:hypothetical protein
MRGAWRMVGRAWRLGIPARAIAAWSNVADLAVAGPARLAEPVVKARLGRDEWLLRAFTTVIGTSWCRRPAAGRQAGRPGPGLGGPAACSP